ncbi:MAG: hypothetical protein BMS9Abin30_0948 [Gammaproteobacteria bacterium]|nr:MAG: hypothetical protein BMS9Abin30_0948 [Gammaproteobacteria bacterium]
MFVNPAVASFSQRALSRGKSMVLDIFALVVIALLIAVAIWLVVLLGSWPGNIARKRNHPQAEAITALGWIGIITLGASWLVAVVWAYYIPSSVIESDLQTRVEALESQLKQAQARGRES